MWLSLLNQQLLLVPLHNSFLLGIYPYFLHVGVDVMDIKVTGRQTISEFFDIMTNCFTPFEWRTIRKPNLERDRLEQFFIHWCLKEAYIKAGTLPLLLLVICSFSHWEVGIGLGFELQRAQFTLSGDHK